VDVADGAQPLAGLVHGEFGGQPLAQQACAPPLDVTVAAGTPLGVGEPLQGGAAQVGPGLLALRGEVGEPVGAFGEAEVGAEDRIEFDQGVDMGVGDLPGQGRVLRGIGHGAHPRTAAPAASSHIRPAPPAAHAAGPGGSSGPHVHCWKISRVSTRATSRREVNSSTTSRWRSAVPATATWTR